MGVGWGWKRGRRGRAGQGSSEWLRGDRWGEAPGAGVWGRQRQEKAHMERETPTGAGGGGGGGC